MFAPTPSWARRLWQKFAILALGLVSLVPAIASAANITFNTNTSLTISGSGINLIILSGSVANSLVVTSTTFTVTVGAAETFTVRYPGPTPGTLANNGGLNSCNISGSNNDVTVFGPSTVTFTPTTTACSAGGGGGLGGGGTSTPATSVTIESPNGGEIVEAGSTTQIKWSTTGPNINSITIRLSTDGGLNFPTVVASNLINSFSYTWTIPADQPSTKKARIKVEATSSNGSGFASSVSNANFELRGTGTPADADPQPVTNVLAFAGDREIRVNWENPTNIDFVGVRIVRKQDAVPGSNTDGLIVYEGQDSTLLDTNLSNGITYFYALYSYNKNGAFSSQVVVSGTPAADAVTPQPDSVPSPAPAPETSPSPSDPLLMVEFIDLPSVLTFKPGETFPVSYVLHNNDVSSRTFNLTRTIVDPSGASTFVSNGFRVVPPGSSVTVDVTYTVPPKAVVGTYAMVVAVVIDGKSAGEAKLFFSVATTDSSLAQRLSGRIVLDVQSHGEAWYIYPKNLKRYYLGRPDDAYALMRLLGLGITNENLDKIPVVGNGGSTPPDMIKNVSGYILLQVQAHGEAWYVDPLAMKRQYMANGTDAFNIMRSLGLGITRVDLDQIPIGSL